ncbi:MAG: hypothetical protein P8Y30_00725, partial [candidate division WOR-3 bacterium]
VGPDGAVVALDEPAVGVAFGGLLGEETTRHTVGGGFPIAVYGGRKEIMDLIAEDKVLRAGTLNANRVVIKLVESLP